MPLKPARAIAVQNIAARKDTAYPQLAKRLMTHVTSDTSRRRFEQLGFNWEAGALGAKAADKALIAKGKTLFLTKICFTCHQTDKKVPAPVGLALKAPVFMGNFWGKEREVELNENPGAALFTSSGNFVKVKMDEAYVVESIEKPMEKVVRGSIPGMAPLPTCDVHASVSGRRCLTTSW